MPRVLMSLLGVALILWAAMSVALGVVGERATAVVTHIRREGGERADVVPNRYAYNISYTFTVSEGKKVDGFAKRVGGSTYVKADGTGRIAVRYLKAMPCINAPEEDTRFSLRQPILVAVGVFLIVRMQRKPEA